MPQGSSEPVGSQSRKRKSKPTSKARAAKQKLKDRYAHAREDAQLAGLIPTTPEEALQPERVDPALQTEQPLPGLIGQAIRKGWGVPEEKKPRLVDELVEMVENPEVYPAVKVMAYNALKSGDKDQWERDNPEAAGKTKGSMNVNVGVQTSLVVDPYQMFQRAMEEVQQDEVEERLKLERERQATEIVSEQATTDQTSGPNPSNS